VAQKPRKSTRFYRNEKWNNVCSRFVESISNAETRRHYSGTLYRLIEFVTTKYGSPRTPDKITKEDIEEFLRQPAQDTGLPTSAYTFNTYLNAIRAFYLHCTRTLVEFRSKKVPLMRKGQLPTDTIGLAKTGEVDRDMVESEVRAFFAAIDRTTLRGKRDYALFWALFITGRRRKEITILRRGDLEPFEFEGGRRGWLYHFHAKWRVTKESAEMPQTVISALIDFHQAAGRNFATMPPETPLFPGLLLIARQPLPLNGVDIRFRIYARRAGIADSIVVHSLRWENAYQRYLANGNDLIKTQEEMGWRSAEQAIHYIRRRRRKQGGDLTAAKLAAKFQ
jgi:site-specific recombinase XerD